MAAESLRNAVGAKDEWRLGTQWTLGTYHSWVCPQADEVALWFLPPENCYAVPVDRV